MLPPLSALRVLDLSTEIAGPYCTKLLADAGAEVLKIELPGGDPLRRWTASHTELPPGADSVLFRFLNTSKRSAVLDYRTAAGRAELLRVCADADLVVDSEQRDLDWGAPATRSPALSVISLSPFGLHGPWSQRPATEFTLQAWCGSTAARGTPDRPPIAAGGRLGEWLGGTYAAAAALTVVHRARQTGRGEHVDLSLFEVMTLCMAPNLMVWESLAGQPSPFARTLELPSIEPARDGYVGFCTITGQQWRDFLVLIERPDLVDDEQLAKWDERVRRSGEVNALIHAWTRTHDVAAIVERAARLRIPVAAVGTPETIAHFDHFVERGTFVQHPGADFVQPRPPYRLSAAPLRAFSPAPRLGAHAAAWNPRPSTPPSDAAGGARGGAAQKPLAGLRVIDFTAFWAGPFVTQYLAAMGADVIKIESIQRPDGMRFQRVRPPTTAQWWEWSALFQTVNLGKRGITVDLTRPAGVHLAQQLIGVSDVVVENFSPRVMDNLGLGYDALAALNPRLIMVRMPAFGLDGPWRDRVGFAQTMEQLSGMAWLTGFRDGPPVIPRGPCDPLAGLHAVVALLVALEHRRATGCGQLVEVTMVEAALNAAADIVLEHAAYGARLMRDGNRGPVAAPQNLYACRGADAWIAIAVVTDAQWQALVDMLGGPDWLRAAPLRSAAGRRDAQDEIDRALAQWCISQEAADLAERLLARGIPAAPVTSAAHLSRNPQLQARRFFETVGHPVVGTHQHPGLPLHLATGSAPTYARPAPTLGEHNREILSDLLGLSAAQIDRLQADGIIGDRPLGT